MTVARGLLQQAIWILTYLPGIQIQSAEDFFRLDLEAIFALGILIRKQAPCPEPGLEISSFPP